MGVTVHQPEDIVLPPTMTSMPTGTWMLSGTSVIINGKEVKKDYSRINLESLKVQYGLKMSTFVENFKCSPSLHYAELSVSLTTKRHNENSHSLWIFSIALNIQKHSRTIQIGV